MSIQPEFDPATRAHEADPLAETEYGTVRGTWDGPVAVWRSIPYAAAPAGPARFARPEPPKPWDGVRDCVVFGDIAPQAMGAMVPVDSDLQMGEDCLWVNVWSPRPEPNDDAPRPVLVWVHGGAYCLGTAAQTIYDGRKLAEAGDVVVVSVNYALRHRPGRSHDACGGSRSSSPSRAAAACLVPLRKALGIAPADALRSE